MRFKTKCELRYIFFCSADEEIVGSSKFVWAPCAQLYSTQWQVQVKDARAGSD